MTKEQEVNAEIQLIKDRYSLDTNLISDGYHTFGELYEHRITLFIALCRLISKLSYEDVWQTNPKDGWFILGIGKEKGYQITYHLPVSKFKECDFAQLLEEYEYEFDGHTSADVLERLKQL